jgi:hypothetical protein
MARPQKSTDGKQAKRNISAAPPSRGRRSPGHSSVLTKKNTPKREGPVVRRDPPKRDPPKRELFRNDAGQFVNKYTFARLLEEGFVTKKHTNVYIKNKRSFIRKTIQEWEIARSKKYKQHYKSKRRRQKDTGHKIEKPAEAPEVVEVGERGGIKRILEPEKKIYETYIRWGYASGKVPGESRVFSGRGAAVIPGVVSLGRALWLTLPRDFWGNWIGGEMHRDRFLSGEVFMAPGSGVHYYIQFESEFGFKFTAKGTEVKYDMEDMLDLDDSSEEYFMPDL